MDPQTYIQVEDNLTRRLVRSWRPYALQVFTNVASAVARGDFSEAYDLAGKLQMKEVAAANRQHVKYALLASGMVGARMARPHGKLTLSTADSEKVLVRATEQLVQSVEVNVTLGAYEQLVQLIAQAERGELIQKAEAATPTRRFVQEFQSFKQEGDKRLQLISALHTSRLATWGFTGEAEVVGLTTYRLSNVMDPRTTPFCRMIHGRTFQVLDARQSIVTILNAEQPDDLKRLQPWPKQTKTAIEEYRKLTPEQLVQRNLHIPPYHPWCRTLCHRVETRQVKVPRPGFPAETPPPEPRATQTVYEQDSFNIVGTRLPPKQLDLWNENVPTSPSQVLSKVTGKSPVQLVTEAKGKTPKPVFTMHKDGNLTVRTKGPLAGPESKVEISVGFSPASKTVTLNHLEVRAGAVAGETFVRETYPRVVGLARLLGAASVVLGASGSSGAAANARFGFVPSQHEWLTLQQDLLDDLGEDGRLEDAMPEDEEQRGILLGILQSSDPRGIWALVDFPAQFGNRPLGEVLLAGRFLQMSLSLGDEDAMKRFEGYFG